LRICARANAMCFKLNWTELALNEKPQNSTDKLVPTRWLYMGHLDRELVLFCTCHRSEKHCRVPNRPFILS
jgi:hypothetical protein